MIKISELMEHQIEFIKVEMDGAFIKVNDFVTIRLDLSYNNLGRDAGELIIEGGGIEVLGFEFDAELDSSNLPEFILSEIITFEQNIDHYQQDWLKRSDDAVKWAKEEGRAR